MKTSLISNPRSLADHAAPAVAALAFLGLVALSPPEGARAEDVPLASDPASTVPGVPGETADIASLISATPTPIPVMPDQKRSLVLKVEEANPYGKRAPEIELREEDAEVQTEGDEIRKVLTELTVTGRGYGPRGLRVLAGDIIFEQGKYVPQVLEEQTEVVKIESVTEYAVELAWVDPKSGRLTGKKLRLTYDLTPRVNQVMKGQSRLITEREELKFTTSSNPSDQTSEPFERTLTAENEPPEDDTPEAVFQTGQ